MSEIVAQAPAKAGFRPSFHLWMVLALCFFIFGGFGLTYLGPMAAGTRAPDPPIVHLHGAVFFSWMLLLVTQSLLVNVKNVKLHRSLGTFGIGLGAILVFMGLLITLISTTDSRVPVWDSEDYRLLYLSYVAPLTFAALFVLAIRAVRKPAVHRNLILLATISILMPGINRLYMVGFGLDYVPFYPTYATMDVLMALILWHESKVTGTVNRMTWIGAAIVFVPQVLMPLVSSWEPYMRFSHWTATLVYYR